MPTSIDSLQIELTAEAQKANNTIDKLVGKLDLLSKKLNFDTSSLKELGNIDGDNLSKVGIGIEALSKGVSSLNGIKKTSYNTIASGIERFGKIDSGNLEEIGKSLVPLANGVSLLSNVDFNNKSLQNLINSITRLSNANIQNLHNVDFTSIGNSINSLANSLATAPKVQQSVISLTNAIANLAKSGNNIPAVSANLGALGDALKKFINSMSNVSSVSADTIVFSQAIASLASAGNKTATTASNLSQLAVALRDFMNTMSTANSVSASVIQMTNALANLANQGGRVSTASRGLVGGLNSTHKSMNITRASAGGLASAFGRLYANYFLVIRGAKAFVNAIKDTSDYIEAFNYYNVAFGKIADEWDKDWEKYGYNNAEAYADSFTERMQESLSKMSGLEVVIDADGKGLLTSTNLQNLGLNIQEITQYASQLASVTNSVGQTGEVSLAAARSFSKLGADLSSLFNIDYSDAMANLQSGLIGQSRALYKYGIDITNATLQTYAYELGLKKSVSEMTQAEKMQLRMVAILDQSRVAWGDLANTINSPSNMLRQFTNNLSEVGMVLGQLFIPLMERVMPVVNGATIAIKNFLVNIASLLGIKIDFDAFGEGFNQVGEEAGDLSDGLDDLSASAKKTNKQLGKFDELNNITLPNASTNGSGLGSSIDLTEEIVKATEEYEKVWNEAFEKMEARANLFAEEIGKIFEPITKPFEEMLVNLKLGGWTQAGENAGEIASGLFDLLSDGIEQVNWTEVGNNVGKFLKGIEWLEVIKSGLSLTQNISDALAELWFGSLKEAPFETLIGTFLVGLSIFASPKVVLAPILAFQAGFSVGKEIGKLLFPDGKEYYENFKWFGEGGFFEEIQNTDFKTLLDAFDEMSTNIMNNPVYRFLTGSFLFPKRRTSSEIKEEWEEFGENFKEITDNIGFSIDVLKDNFIEKFSKMGNAAGEAFRSFKEDAPVIFEEFKLGVLNKINSLKENLEEFFSIEEWSFSGVKEGLSKTFDGAINAIKGIWNKFAEWLNEKLTIKIDTSGLIGKGISELLGGNEIHLGKLPTYQTGGFPEDGLFMANRGELVGRFSNGQTAVANNEQIVSGIEGGVERAVTRVLAPYLVQIAQNTRETADKEFGITEKQIFDANRRQSQYYTKRTGKPV